MQIGKIIFWLVLLVFVAGCTSASIGTPDTAANFTCVPDQAPPPAVTRVPSTTQQEPDTVVQNQTAAVGEAKTKPRGKGQYARTRPTSAKSNTPKQADQKSATDLKRTPDWKAEIISMLERDQSKEAANPSRFFQQQPVAVVQRPPPVDHPQQIQSGTEGHGPGDVTSSRPSDTPMAVVSTRKTVPAEPRQPQSPDDSSSGLIMPGDLLSIRVNRRAALTIQQYVSNAGEIVMPMVGSVLVAGLTLQQARNHIARLLAAHHLVNPRVDLRVKRSAESKTANL